MGKPNPGDAARLNRLIGVVLSAMLAVSMVPAVSIQSAFADEPVERPATTGGDAALEGYAAESVPVAVQREDGALAADGLLYATTDGGLALIGFDGLVEGDAPKDIVVPEAVSVDGNDAPILAVAIAEGQAAESALSLMLPQSVNDIDTAVLAQAFPSLAAIEIAAPKASAPVAAGAAAMRAAYSSFGGVLYRNAWVATDGDASQTTLTKELVWAPPATVVARIPAECTSIAPGVFADAKDLKTVVCFGVVEDIPQTQKADDGTVTSGAFTDEQIQTVNIIVPQTGTVVTDGDRVSADVAVTDHSTMDVKREAWWKSGFASDRITLGEVYGSTTSTLPVNEEGALETTEAEVAYAPETTQNSSSRKAGIEPPESAIPTPVPDDDELDPSESGLVFTHLADMTLSVSWKGDPTATPAHLEIPAYAIINGVTYPVTEIAPEAFKGAVFLTSITIPETVKSIGESAFEGCTNLSDSELSSALRAMVDTTSAEASAPLASAEENETNRSTPAQGETAAGEETASLQGDTYVGSPANDFDDSISALSSSVDECNIVFFPALANELTISQPDGNVEAKVFGSNRIDVVRTNSAEAYPSAIIDSGGDLYVSWRSAANGNRVAWIAFAPPPGWAFGNVSSLNNSRSTTPSSPEEIDVSLVRSESVGEYPLLTKGSFAGTGSADTAARSDHDHDGVYIKSIDEDTWAKRSWVDENYLTKAATELDNFYGKAAFNTISYDLAGGRAEDPFPTFYVSDAAKRPTVPDPVREGYSFQGWTWERGEESGSGLAGAFSGEGAVRLTAEWGEPATPEATHFFTGERPLRHDDASERQTHVIKVRLSNVPRTLASVSFEGDDRTHLLKDMSGVELYVGASEDAISSGTRLAWGGSTGGGWTCDLAEFGTDSYGVYVGVSIPTSAIDEASVPVSYTDGSYVASLVKMNYVFA